MRRTTAAALTTREADNNDRQRCSLCLELVLDGFEAAHADAHFRNRDAGRPTFTPAPSEPDTTNSAGLHHGPITTPKEKP